MHKYTNLTRGYQDLLSTFVDRLVKAPRLEYFDVKPAEVQSFSLHNSCLDPCFLCFLNLQGFSGG